MQTVQDVCCPQCSRYRVRRIAFRLCEQESDTSDQLASCAREMLSLLPHPIVKLMFWNVIYSDVMSDSAIDLSLSVRSS